MGYISCSLMPMIFILFGDNIYTIQKNTGTITDDGKELGL
jgi:hypothetical protein